MESKKIVLMNLLAGQQWRNRHREQTYGHEGKGEGGMYEESNREIYNTIFKIDIQWEFALQHRELKQGLCDRLKVGWGERWEGGLGVRGHGCTYGRFILMHNRKLQNSVRQLSFN